METAFIGADAEPSHSHKREHFNNNFLKLLLGSVGVVYGDIGTSPLYAFRESLAVVDEDGISAMEVLGLVSLLIWALVIVVTLKYVLILMRADNKGEGGILSLMALARGVAGKYQTLALGLGMAGAALFYGDAILTPAISILSAVEGLKHVAPDFQPFILPVALAIIVALFLVQSRGTGKIAAFFGPITVLWFVMMAVIAIPYIVEHPAILRAFSPYYGAYFFYEHHWLGMAVLGAIFLAVTGAEALYADMGHFGKKPIRWAWMVIVFPALTINYLGQGALIFENPQAAEDPFYLMTPAWALLPMVILATCATVIASQAVITGAFSLTQQAIQLGLMPRMIIKHTSETMLGQIFMPQINLFLLLGVVWLVVEFKTSSNLSSAYGIAVSGTMLTTTLLAFLVIWKLWKKPFWLVTAVIIPFLFVDITFLIANFLKLFQGGYIPLLLGIGIVVIMWTWRCGSQILLQKTRENALELDDLMYIINTSKPARVPGTAVFLSNNPDIAPTILLNNLKHNKVLHEKNIVLTVKTEPVPRIHAKKRAEVRPLVLGMVHVTLHFGYMETPNVTLALNECRKYHKDFDIDLAATSFFLGRRVIKESASSGMPLWQDKLYIMLARNATRATQFFHIPPHRVVELGIPVTV